MVVGLFPIKRSFFDEKHREIAQKTKTSRGIPEGFRGFTDS
jgi:hypothetical protein